MAPKNNTRFATTVREAMTRLGLTQAEVAARGGPSDTTLRKILDQEPIGISTATLTKLDAAFGWEPGSAAAVLSGGVPIVRTSIRGEHGRPILTVTDMDGAQEELEQLRLATIIADTRDSLADEPSPLLRTLARQLDEAEELAIRAIARHHGGGDLSNDEIEDARTLAASARSMNHIRRQGEVYVTTEESGERLSPFRKAGRRLSSVQQRVAPDDGEEADRITDAPRKLRRVAQRIETATTREDFEDAAEEATQARIDGEAAMRVAPEPLLSEIRAADDLVDRAYRAGKAALFGPMVDKEWPLNPEIQVNVPDSPGEPQFRDLDPRITGKFLEIHAPDVTWEDTKRPEVIERLNRLVATVTDDSQPEAARSGTATSEQKQIPQPTAELAASMTHEERQDLARQSGEWAKFLQHWTPKRRVNPRFQK